MKSLTRKELKAALVARKPDDHKGAFGHVLILAGSRGMAGAAVLCGRAALRSGAGLVTIGVPAGIQAVVAGQVPEAMTLGLAESGGALSPEAVGTLSAAGAARRYTVMALGPGLSTQGGAPQFVVHALSALSLPAVVDADAVNVLALQDPVSVRQMLAARGPGRTIFTPHAGEMARALRIERAAVDADRPAAAERLAKEWSAVAVLKGHRTLISDGSRTVVNATGDASLAKGGSGDILTGLVAGLWAQMLASGRVPDDQGFRAAALAAHLHGLAGQLAGKEMTAWAVTASDVVERLPKAFSRLAA